jgi:hypothetical protein
MGNRAKKKLTKIATKSVKPPQLTVEFNEENWRWLRIAAELFRLEPGNVLKLALHRLCERILIEKSRLVSWQASELVKQRLGNKIQQLIKEETTVLDNPNEIEKLLAPIIATNADLAERIRKPQRPRYGKLYFVGTPSDVALLEEAFSDKEHPGVFLKSTQLRIERTFFDLVAAHKHLYRSMPLSRKRAKRRLTPDLVPALKDIRERKKALENLGEAMRTGKMTGLHALLKKYPDIFSSVRKKALLSPKVSMEEKRALLTERIEKFGRRLAMQNDPTWQKASASLQSKRSSSLLDDPIELTRFLNGGSNNSILSPPHPFWAIRRVAEKGY